MEGAGHGLCRLLHQRERNLRAEEGCAGQDAGRDAQGLVQRRLHRQDLAGYQAAAILKNLASFQFKIICGYPGSADYVLAMQRGEIDLVSSAWNQWRSNHQTELKEGTFVPVMQTGLRRNKELQDVPLLQEMVDDPTSKKIIEFYSAGSAIGRALISPPGVPAGRLDVLRAAFEKVVKDPDFLRDAERVKAEIDPTPGAEVQQDVADILAAPKDIMDRANKAME